MNQKQIDKIVEILRYWSRRADYYEERTNRYEAGGDHDRANRCDQKNTECIVAINAIIEVLNVIGYTVAWTGDGRNTPIVKEITRRES